MADGTGKMRSAARHNRVRRQHSDELAEDYVEAIREQQATAEPVRVTDLQRIFGVSHVSVIRALKRLEDRGLVERSEVDGLQLTEAGREMAETSARRHQLVVRFLGSLGVSEAQAEADAEGVEHHLSRESLRAMESFLRARDATKAP